MLTLVRRFVRFFWGINALVFLSLASGRSLHHRAYVHAATPGMKAFFLIAGLIFAIAWLTNLKAFREGASPRLWGLAGSSLFLLEGLTLLWKGGILLLRVTFLPVALPILIGAAGIVAFAQKPKPTATPAAAPPARIAGDRTNRFTDKLIAGIAVLLQLGAMTFWSFYAREHGIQRHSQVPYLALVVAAALFAAATHECGHAVAGWIFDMRLLSFNAGPFTWRKTRGKWNFNVTWTGLFSGGGAVNVVPTHPMQPAWHEVCVLFAGPLVNLWLGLGVAAALLVPDTIDPEYRVLFELIATYSLLAAIHNMMPFRLEKGAYSDGARILQVATNSPIVDLHRALLGVQATLVTGRRPRDYDIATIERASALFPTEFTGVHLKLCGAHHYIDLGLHDKAAQWLAEAERMVEQHAIPIPAPIHTAFIIDHAFLRQDAAAVTRWFERMEQKVAEDKKPQHQGVDYWLAHASLLWMQGRVEEAKASLEKADAEAQRLPLAGAYEFDRSRCQQLHAVLHAPTQQAEVLVRPPELEGGLASHEPEEWGYPPRDEAASCRQASYRGADEEPGRGVPVNFRPEPSHEYHDLTPDPPQAESPEEPPYQPVLQWPASLKRKYGAA
jgi:hypothetical protein